MSRWFSNWALQTGSLTRPFPPIRTLSTGPYNYELVAHYVQGDSATAYLTARSQWRVFGLYAGGTAGHDADAC